MQSMHYWNKMFSLNGLLAPFRTTIFSSLLLNASIFNLFSINNHENIHHSFITLLFVTRKNSLYSAFCYKNVLNNISLLMVHLKAWNAFTMHINTQKYVNDTLTWCILLSQLRHRLGHFVWQKLDSMNKTSFEMLSHCATLQTQIIFRWQLSPFY